MSEKQSAKKRATRAVEAIGRGHLVSRLIREGIGVSLPLWDDGIDLIAHVSDGSTFDAAPLQLKVSTNTYIGIDHKYKTRPKMKMVFVWINSKDELSKIFVMSYADLLSLFAKHANTQTFKEKGFYYSKAPKDKLKQMKKFEFPGSRSLRQLIFAA